MVYHGVFCYGNIMSHITTAKSLKQKCEAEGMCAEYNEFLAKEIARYEQSANSELLWVAGGGLVFIFLAIILALVPHKQRIKSIVLWIFKTSLIVSPVVLLITGGGLIGFSISFSACFKQPCSALEESAIYIIPALALLISLPISSWVKRKILPRFDFFLGNRRKKFWYIAAMALVIITVTAVGVAVPIIQDNKNNRIEDIRNP